MKKLRSLIVLFFLYPSILFAQKDTLVKKLDSLNVTETKDDKGKNNDISSAAYNDSTKLTFSNYFILLGNNFKQHVTYPFHAKTRDWIRFAEFAGLVTTLSFADKTVNRNVTHFAAEHHSVASVGKFVTHFGGLYEVYTLGALATVGYVFKNDKIKTTVLLASQSYIMAFAMENIFKVLAARQRPNYVSPATNKISPRFHGPVFYFGNTNHSDSYSSFPSGHTTLAFAAATVYAMEYRNHPWIPIASYSFASLIGITRLTENKHWLTDVLCGAALGFVSGRQVVNNYHRYMKIKQPERSARRKRGIVSLSLSPFYGRVLPGVTYSF